MFDDMSLSESLGVAFGYVDDDKDGYITKDEMIVALLEYNDTLISDAPESALLNPEAYFTKLFPQIDADGDGVITIEEGINFFSDVLKPDDDKKEE